MERQDSPGQHRSHARHVNEIDVEIVESIATCSCSHTLGEHTDRGCSVKGCDCELERESMVVSEVVAIDEL